MVCWVLVLTMISPPAGPFLDTAKPGDAFVNALVWTAPSRWGAEVLYAAQTRRLSLAWKMPPSFYEKPERESALAIILACPFQEAFAQRDPFLKVTESNLEAGVCEVKGQYSIVENVNLPILVCLGLMTRLLALGLLRFTALHKRGEVPLGERLAGCFFCCRGKDKDGVTTVGRMALVPSFLTGSVFTKDDSVTKAREEPTSPTVVSDLTAVTTEQPGHFESVPSIPSDLYD